MKTISNRTARRDGHHAQQKGGGSWPGPRLDAQLPAAWTPPLRPGPLGLGWGRLLGPGGSESTCHGQAGPGAQLTLTNSRNIRLVTPEPGPSSGGWGQSPLEQALPRDLLAKKELTRDSVTHCFMLGGRPSPEVGRLRLSIRPSVLPKPGKVGQRRPSHTWAQLSPPAPAWLRCTSAESQEFPGKCTVSSALPEALVPSQPKQRPGPHTLGLGAFSPWLLSRPFNPSKVAPEDWI